jgi:hypothetical protein
VYEDSEEVKADEQPVLVGLLVNGRLKAPEFDWKFFEQLAAYADANREELRALVAKCAAHVRGSRGFEEGISASRREARFTRRRLGRSGVERSFGPVMSGSVCSLCRDVRHACSRVAERMEVTMQALSLRTCIQRPRALRGPQGAGHL